MMSQLFLIFCEFLCMELDSRLISIFTLSSYDRRVGLKANFQADLYCRSCICPNSRNSHLQNRLGLGQVSLLLVFPLDVHVAGWNGDRAQSSLARLCPWQLTQSLLQMEVQETGLGAERLTGTSVAVLKDAGVFSAC